MATTAPMTSCRPERRRPRAQPAPAREGPGQQADDDGHEGERRGVGAAEGRRREVRPDEVGEEPRQGAGQRAGQRRHQDGADRIEVDGDLQGAGHGRAQDDVEGHGHRHQHQRARVELARHGVQSARLQVLDERVGGDAGADGQPSVTSAHDGSACSAIDAGQAASPTSASSAATTKRDADADDPVGLTPAVDARATREPADALDEAARRTPRCQPPRRRPRPARDPRRGASRRRSRPSSSGPPAPPRPRSASVRARPGSSAAASRQGIVDEGAVEAVVAAVELEVEAQGVGDEAHDGVLRAAARRPRVGQRAPGARASAWRAR